MKQETTIDVYFRSLVESFSKLYPLAAIWLEKPYKMGPKITNRITIDDLIKIEAGKLVNWEDGPTHVITKIIGTLSNNILQIEAKDLITNEIQTITI